MLESDIAGGTYNSVAKTITWNDLITGIDTYANAVTGEITITKNITLAYLGITGTGSIDNEVEGDTILYTPAKQLDTKPTDDHETLIDVNIDINVVKSWTNEGGDTSNRPTSVKYTLKGRNGAVVEGPVTTSEADYGYTFTNKPKYDAEGEIPYTIEETEVTTGDLRYYSPSSAVTGSTDTTKTITLTNTYGIPSDTVNIEVVKEWSGDSGNITHRPSSVKYTLKGRNGAVVEGPVTTSAVDYGYTFTSKPKYDAEGVIPYTIEETEVAPGDLAYYTKGYETTSETITEKEITVTNTYGVPADTVNISVIKAWTGEGGNTTQRPASVQYTLKGRSGVVVEGPVEATSGADYGYIFTSKPKYDEDGLIPYTIEETEVTVGDLMHYTAGYENIGYIHTVTNAYGVPSDTIDINVVKEWIGEPNTDNRPASVKYTLKGRNNVTVEGPVTTSASDYGYTFTNKAKYDGLGEIPYTILEEEVALGDLLYYTPSATQTAQDSTSKTITVTNTYGVPTTEFDLTVEKAWVNEPNESKRPSSIKYVLKANGSVLKDSGELTSPFDYTFEDLDRYDGEGLINYTVEEAEIHTGDLLYYRSEAVRAGDTVTVTNTFEVPSSTIDIIVEKAWANEGGDTSNRPTSVKYLLKANGTPVGTAQESDASYGYTFANMPKYNESGKIDYTVEEVEVATGDLLYYVAGYETTSETATEKTITVTNTYEVPSDTIDINVVKAWENEPDTSKRPTSIKYVLKANGVEVDEETVTAPYGHKFTAPKYDKDGIITYTVEEEEVTTRDLMYYVAGHETTNETATDKDIKITNTYTVPDGNIGSPSITKTGTPEIQKTDDEILYNIRYIATIGNYIGTVKTTVVDHLPYKIDQVKSTLAGGTYNEAAQTITWVEETHNVNTSLDGAKNIDIQKTIKLVYLDVPAGTTEIENQVTGKTEITGKDDTKQDEWETIINPDVLPGKVIIEHYLEGTDIKIGDDGELIGGIGSPYTTEALAELLSQYELVAEPGNKDGAYQVTDTIVKYYYRKKDSGTVTVKYLEKGTDKPLETEEKHKGKVGEQYTFIEKDVDGYKIVERPNTKDIQLTIVDQEYIYYYEKLTFDLQVEKWISKLETTKNGVTSTQANTYETKDNLLKADVRAKDEGQTEIQVTYTIRVSNIGEVSGEVGEIREFLPTGLKYSGGDTGNWKLETEGIYINETLKNETINPGEYKEVEIQTTWERGEYGTKINTAKILKLENKYGYEDINTRNNETEAEILIGVATGLKTALKINLVAITLLIGIAVYVKRKKINF